MQIDEEIENKEIAKQYKELLKIGYLQLSTEDKKEQSYRQLKNTLFIELNLINFSSFVNQGSVLEICS